MTATGKPAEVMAALFARTALLANSGPRLPISFPEVKFTPPTDGKYLKVNLFANVLKWEGVADGFADQGLLQVSVIWPKAQGLIAPASVADLVRAHFVKGSILTSGSTSVKISQQPWVTSPISEEDSVILPVTVPWTA